jgi:hypothetical protein
MERFLSEVCTPTWNLHQDAGRAWADAVAMLPQQYPEHAGLTRAYRLRWSQMIAGNIPGTVAPLRAQHAAGTPFYSLTNWLHETLPIAEQPLDCPTLFRGIIVSGREKLVKPYPAIYHLAEQGQRLRWAAVEERLSVERLRTYHRLFIDVIMTTTCIPEVRLLHKIGRVHADDQTDSATWGRYVAGVVLLWSFRQKPGRTCDPVYQPAGVSAKSLASFASL